MCGTVFKGAKIKLWRVVLILHMCLLEMNHSQIIHKADIFSAAATDYIKYFCQPILKNVNEELCAIGGPGIEPQIDKAKFAKQNTRAIPLGTDVG